MMGRTGPDDSGDEVTAEGEHDGGDGDDAVRFFDAEELNTEWSGVRPGVDYVRGGYAAQRAAVAVCALYRRVDHTASLDRVQAMTDLDGQPYLRVDLNVAGVYDVIGLVLDGLRLRGEPGDETG